MESINILIPNLGQKTVISEGDIDKKSQTLNYEAELLSIISVTGLDLSNATASKSSSLHLF